MNRRQSHRKKAGSSKKLAGIFLPADLLTFKVEFMGASLNGNYAAGNIRMLT